LESLQEINNQQMKKIFMLGRVIVINFNKSDFTYTAVKSILEQLNDQWMIEIVDNGSSLTELIKIEEIAKSNSRIELFKHERNVGPGRAIRMAMQRALDEEFRYLIVCHNDTKMLKNCIEFMHETISQDSNIAAVGALQLDWDWHETVIFAGGLFSKYGFLPKILLRNTPLNEVTQEAFHVDWLEFTCICFDTTWLKKIGLPLSEFTFYWEDTEWCIRASKSGAFLSIDPRARVLHRIGGTLGTSSKSDFFWENWCKNYFIVQKIHGNKLDKIVSVLALSYIVLRSIIQCRFMFGVSMIRGVLKAVYSQNVVLKD
jgi:GT2 family glycosyltransferase